jgi:hypothetical protein
MRARTKLAAFSLPFVMLVTTRVPSINECAMYSNNDTMVSIIGTYKSPDHGPTNYTFESLTLKPDYTFDYLWKDEFIALRANGFWKIVGSNLVLNSAIKKVKISVQQKIVNLHSGKLKFAIKYDNGDSPNYQLFLIGNEKTMRIRNLTTDTIVAVSQPLRSFFVVDSRGIKYPDCRVKNKKINSFDIKLNRDRVFDNEKWVLVDNKLRPMGLDGKLASYYLSK